MSPEQLDGFEIKVENHLAFPYAGVLDFGACFPPGEVREGDGFHLEDREGRSLPLEWRPLLRDEDGTVSWAHFHFPVELGKRRYRHLKVRPGAVTDYRRLHLESTEDGFLVRNGGEEWIFSGTSVLGLTSLSRDGVVVLKDSNSAAAMEFTSETYALREPLELSLYRANSFEAVVQAVGKLRGEAGEEIYLRLRYTIQVGRPGCNVNVYFSNRRESNEDLVLQRFALSFGLNPAPSVCVVRQQARGNHCAPENYAIAGGVRIRNGALVDTSPLDIPAESELWAFFRRRDWKTLFSRVAPYCGIHMGPAGVLFAWQRATLLEVNSFSAGDGIATMELISPSPDGRRIPQGFSRSFDFSVLSMGPEAGDEAALDKNALGEEAFRAASVAEFTPLVSVHPQWFINNGVEEMDRMLPYRPDIHPRFEKQLWRDYALDYFSGFYHCGDYPSGRGPLQTRVESRDFTWNNNEEDHLKGLAWMLMRTGDPSYREDMLLCARHLLEVDRIAYSGDPLRTGLFIAHAKNHFDGAGYPSHCWAEGVLLYYKLSGEDDALAAFFALCDSLLLWAELPDRKRFTDAREMGVPVTNFAHAYKLSRDTKYLDAARLYIGGWQRQMGEDGGLYYRKGAHFIPYAEYVAVEALWDFYELIGGDDVRLLLLQVINWIWETQMDSSGVYDGRSTSEAFLHIFYIAYRLTGDEVWLERGRPGLDAALSQSALHPLLKFNNNAAFYHEAMKRGWLRDDLVPLEPCRSSRAVFRTYSEPLFGWTKTR